MLVLTHNIIVRGMNVVSKILHLNPPLYEQKWFRWMICLPQWAYLQLSRNLRLGVNNLTIKEKLEQRFDHLVKRTNALNEVNHWLTCSYLLIARKPIG